MQLQTCRSFQSSTFPPLRIRQHFFTVIISFKHKGLRDFFEANSKRGIPTELSTRLRDRLDVIDAAGTLEDIALPPVFL